MIAAVSPLSALLLFLAQTAVVSPHPLETRATIVNSASSLNERYDYVVVGGGTSGLTVANRLTEDPSEGKRANFHLLTLHSVTRILINKEKRATGVEISGIGPRKLLKGLRIKVMQDLPGVGYRLQDQPTMYASVTYPDTQAYLSGTTVAFLSLQRLTNQYQEIIQSAKQADLKKALPAGADKTLLEGYKAQQSAILADYGSPDTAVHELAAATGETIPLVLIKPLSRGSILMDWSDPHANPVFDYGTFHRPADVQVFVAIYKKFRQFVGAEPWKAVGLRETSPGPGLQGDGAIKAAIRNISVSTWQHAVETCAMMPKKHGGVVDPQLRVYEIKGLSVVDASMMPIIPATHTSASVYAVAEKMSTLDRIDGMVRGGFAGEMDAFRPPT
ncbi:MAG: hypothetical protein Q9173_001983 [Seirophora scorigena]